jgi:hypothetical protein
MHKINDVSCHHVRFSKDVKVHPNNIKTTNAIVAAAFDSLCIALEVKFV